MDEKTKNLVSLLKRGRIVAFCGAGISAESGIPTFRGEDGLWKKYDPTVYATVEGIVYLLIKSPLSLRDFIVESYQIFLNAQPNFAHYALKKLEDKNLLIGIITQNIDDLHFRCGSKNVAEIHGNAFEFLCRRCNWRIKRTPKELESFIYQLKKEKSKWRIVKGILKFLGRCPQCNRRLESGIVFFGQQLPQKELERSYQYLNQAKTLLCIGTSGVVYPAASLPYYAKERGVKIVVINPEASELDEIADYLVREEASQFFRRIIPFLG